MKKFLPILAAACIGATSSGGVSAQAPLHVAELADLELEQLARLSVTSASRRPERLADVPASIFVITAEDIRRSGVTSLYEALRLAPNLTVVRGDASQYIATARGGLAGTANKMLVLVDGRTVYSPLFSGVFSDAQFVFLEDVERIEIVSGPGSTLYGTNAVNGVINVITKFAARTPGTLASVTAGEDERGASFRHGFAAGAGDARAYLRYHERDENALASGASARDSAERWFGGARYDGHWQGGTFTAQAEGYQADVDNLGGLRPLSGGHVLARYRGARAGGGDVLAQAYYDRTEREHTGSFAEVRDTVDAEAQLGSRWGAHQVVWGGNYRVSRDRTVTTPALGFMPEERTLRLASLYAQDDWQASPALKATFGVRAEHNSYTGLEWLPNVRVSYQAAPDHLAWAALTRTVRSPSRIDRELVVPGQPPYAVVPGDFQSEIAKVAELGYRGRLGGRMTLSLTAFHHEFERLRTVEPSGGALAFGNGGEGRVHGVEGWIDWAVTRDWRLVGGFVAMRSRFEVAPGRVDLGGGGLGNDPERTATLRSQWNMTRAVDFDVAIRHVGELPAPHVPAYTVLDLSVGWRVSRTVELTLSVANALDKVHREFSTAGTGAVFGRSALLKATWTP
jgi:iron complex outermembrane receptor protein